MASIHNGQRACVGSHTFALAVVFAFLDHSAGPYRDIYQLPSPLQAIEDMATTLTTVCGSSVRRFVNSGIDEIELDTEPTSTAHDIVKKCMDRISSSHQHLDCTTESTLKGCLWMVGAP